MTFIEKYCNIQASKIVHFSIKEGETMFKLKKFPDEHSLFLFMNIAIMLFLLASLLFSTGCSLLEPIKVYKEGSEGEVAAANFSEKHMFELSGALNGQIFPGQALKADLIGCMGNRVPVYVDDYIILGGDGSPNGKVTQWCGQRKFYLRIDGSTRYFKPLAMELDDYIILDSRRCSVRRRARKYIVAPTATSPCSVLTPSVTVEFPNFR